MTRAVTMPIEQLQHAAEKGAGDISLVASILGGIAGIGALLWPPTRKAVRFCWDWTSPYVILPVLLKQLRLGQEQANLKHDQILASLERNTIITQANLDLQPTIFWTAGPDGKRTYTSAAWSRITWRDTREAIGDEWQQVIHEDDRERVKREWKSSVDNRLSFSTIARYVRKDGEAVKMKIEGEPRFSASGSVLMFAGTCKPFEVHE